MGVGLACVVGHGTFPGAPAQTQTPSPMHGRVAVGKSEATLCRSFLRGKTPMGGAFPRSLSKLRATANMGLASIEGSQGNLEATLPDITFKDILRPRAVNGAEDN